MPNPILSLCALAFTLKRHGFSALQFNLSLCADHQVDCVYMHFLTFFWVVAIYFLCPLYVK